MGSVRILAMSAILVAGVGQVGIASAQSGDVQIVRGGQPVSIVETREARLRVFRGPPTATLAAIDGKTISTGPVSEAVVSGSTIWFVDGAAGKLRVCRLAPTTQIGEHRIDCHSRALPR